MLNLKQSDIDEIMIAFDRNGAENNREIREAFDNVLADLTPIASATIYNAFLNQSGSNDPVPTVNSNGLSAAIVWTRDGTGTYTGTLEGAFTDAKTAVFMSEQYQNLNPLNSKVEYAANINDADSITVSVATRDNTSGTTTLADGFLFNTLIKIEVYD